MDRVCARETRAGGGGGGGWDGVNRYIQHVRIFITATKRDAALSLLWVNQ